jgi:hypothetical protein
VTDGVLAAPAVLATRRVAGVQYGHPAIGKSGPAHECKHCAVRSAIECVGPICLQGHHFGALAYALGTSGRAHP